MRECETPQAQEHFGAVARDVPTYLAGKYGPGLKLKRIFLLKLGKIPVIAMLVYQKGYREDHSPKHSMGRTVCLHTN